MSQSRLVLAFLAMGLGPAVAAQASSPGPVGVFENAFSTSLYVFDGCGDGVAGEEFRRALAAKFASCSFGKDATVTYERRTKLLKSKVHEMLDQLILDHGGEPMRLEGMAGTCHSHRETEAYQAMRAKLDAFGEGKIDADAIIQAKCDAPEILP